MKIRRVLREAQEAETCFWLKEIYRNPTTGLISPVWTTKAFAAEFDNHEEIGKNISQNYGYKIEYGDVFVHTLKLKSDIIDKYKSGEITKEEMIKQMKSYE